MSNRIHNPAGYREQVEYLQTMIRRGYEAAEDTLEELFDYHNAPAGPIEMTTPVSRSGYWHRYAPAGWKGMRPDGRPEDGGIWEPRLPNGRPAAQYCSDWTEAQ